jgi:hypothetical protein
MGKADQRDRNLRRCEFEYASAFASWCELACLLCSATVTQSTMKRIILFTTLFTTMLSFSAAAPSNPLSVGDPAPQVTAITESGVSLDLGSFYAKQKYTLVYFYPKADTPGCTAQGCSLRDSYEVLTQKSVAIIGVSTDTVKAQADFKAPPPPKLQPLEQVAHALLMTNEFLFID